MQQHLQQYIDRIPPHIRYSLIDASYILFQFLSWISTFSVLIFPLFNITYNNHNITFYLYSAVIDNNTYNTFSQLQSNYNIGCTCSASSTLVLYIDMLLIISTTIHTVLTVLRLSDKLDVLQHIPYINQNERIHETIYIQSIELRVLLVSILLYIIEIFFYSNLCYSEVTSVNNVSNIHSSGYKFNETCIILLILSVVINSYQRNNNNNNLSLSQLDTVDHYTTNNNLSTSTYIPPKTSFNHNNLDTSSFMPSAYNLSQTNTSTLPQFPLFGQPSSTINNHNNNNSNNNNNNTVSYSPTIQPSPAPYTSSNNNNTNNDNALQMQSPTLQYQQQHQPYNQYHPHQSHF